MPTDERQTEGTANRGDRQDTITLSTPFDDVGAVHSAAAGLEGSAAQSSGKSLKSRIAPDHQFSMMRSQLREPRINAAQHARSPQSAREGHE